LRPAHLGAHAGRTDLFKARVALARKLAVLHHLWSREETFGGSGITV
jgi:hypothetical protein